MEITVKMSPSEYDAYRAYQKDKESLEREIEADCHYIRAKHEKLCSAVLGGIEEVTATLYAEKEPVETVSEIKVKNQVAAGEALELAADWFC